MNLDSLRDLGDRLSAGLAGLRQQLPHVIADPRAYPRESMLLALIAVMLLLALVFLFFAVIDSIREFARRRSAKVSVRRKDRWARAVIVAAIVFVALVGLALSPLVPAVGRACGSCHEVSAAVVAWEGGNHAESSCYGCHAGGSFSGALYASVGGAARQLLGAAVAPQEGVASSACLRCHKDIVTATTSGKTRMRHSDVIEAAMACVECHPRTGHEYRDDSAVPERSMMDRCLTCHDGDTASSECPTCHEEAPLDITSGEVPMGATDIATTCRGCHSEVVTKRCIACHGLELPHPQEFMSQHAGASQDDPRICERCHYQADASLGCGCHDDINIHGTYSEWFPRHGTQALADGRIGCNCHKLAFCATCHQSDPLVGGR
ncbi:MAG: hypothetical protein KJ747_07405 [Actinobacteria bacterium]|nr:hypothetical protein [Actinomycetota bacterium]MCG2808026.1 hypothetical protein [Coriobacteriia bacterium]